MPIEYWAIDKYFQEVYNSTRISVINSQWRFLRVASLRSNKSALSTYPISVLSFNTKYITSTATTVNNIHITTIVSIFKKFQVDQHIRVCQIMQMIQVAIHNEINTSSLFEAIKYPRSFFTYPKIELI